MTTPKSWPIRGIVALVALLLFAPLASHADTYQIVGLGIDNVQFYGLSDTGQVVFQTSVFSCGGASTCYGHSGSWSSVAPALTWDNGAPCSPSVPAGTSVLSAACNGGNVAFYGYQSGNSGVEGIYAGAASPQLVASGFFTGPLYVNSLGDIVYDNGGLNEWYEAIDLTTTAAVPEPSSLLLFGTGALALAGFVTFRRYAHA